MHRRVLDRHHGLHAAVEVTRHHVGRADIDHGLAIRKAVTGAEAIDARMLEEAPDDALDVDGLGQIRHARTQAADAAHHEVDLHARLARLVERIDDLGVDEGVHLHPDGGRTPGLGVIHFLADMVEDARPDAVRRHRHGLELGRLGIARDIVEDARQILADGAVGGEEGQVGIDLGSDRVIVAGPHVTIGDELAPLTPHDEAELGVRLELEKAVDHLDASAFEIARPFDVGLLVEAGLQLDHDRHRLAGLGRVFQRLDDRRALARAVERPFDRHDVGIGGRLLQELEHDVEGLVRVVDHDVLLADGGEAVPMMLADALRETADEGQEFEVRPVGDDQLIGVGQPNQALLHEALALRDLELLHDEAL